LTLHDLLKSATQELAMNRSQMNSDYEPIDRKTTRAICDGVGERLQQYMPPETTLPTHLEQLLEKLRRCDNSLH
jgi:hypothetical protein